MKEKNWVWYRLDFKWVPHTHTQKKTQHNTCRRWHRDTMLHAGSRLPRDIWDQELTDPIGLWRNYIYSFSDIPSRSHPGDTIYAATVLGWSLIVVKHTYCYTYFGNALHFMHDSYPALASAFVITETVASCFEHGIIQIELTFIWVYFTLMKVFF